MLTLSNLVHKSSLLKTLKLATLLSLCWFTLPQANAACTLVQQGDQLPITIGVEDCYELQGGNKINEHISVQGRLFVKAGRTVYLGQTGKLIIEKGGSLDIRGMMEMETDSQISVDDNSAFTVSGQLLMHSGSVINSRGAARLRNVGRIMMQGRSFIDLNGDTSFHNGGVISIINAPLHIHHNSNFMNYGTIDTLRNANISSFESSNFLNSGRFSLSKDSRFVFDNQARFTNRRAILINGNFSFLSEAILDNGASLRILNDSYFYVSDSAQVVNHHTIEIMGNSVFNLKSRFLNDGTLAIKKTGNMKILQKALLINTGTFRNEGGQFAIEQKSNFVNENIVSGKESRQQIKETK